MDWGELTPKTLQTVDKGVKFQCGEGCQLRGGGGVGGQGAGLCMAAWRGGGGGGRGQGAGGRGQGAGLCMEGGGGKQVGVIMHVWVPNVHTAFPCSQS